MRFPIDVVFIDHDQIVIRIEHALRPFKTASCRGAREVVELAAGECERRGLEVGDRVAWASRSARGRRLGVAGQLAPARVEGQRPRRERRPAIRQAGAVPARRPRASASQPTFGPTSSATRSRTATSTPSCSMSAIEPRRRRCGSRTPSAPAGPTLPVVIVGEGAAERAPAGVAVYDKWDQMDEAIDALEAGIAGRCG